jgi:hypothetical protein
MGWAGCARFAIRGGAPAAVNDLCSAESGKEGTREMTRKTANVPPCQDRCSAAPGPAVASRCGRGHGLPRPWPALSALAGALWRYRPPPSWCFLPASSTLRSGRLAGAEPPRQHAAHARRVGRGVVLVFLLFCPASRDSVPDPSGLRATNITPPWTINMVLPACLIQSAIRPPRRRRAAAAACAAHASRRTMGRRWGRPAPPPRRFGCFGFSAGRAATRRDAARLLRTQPNALRHRQSLPPNGGARSPRSVAISSIAWPAASTSPSRRDRRQPSPAPPAMLSRLRVRTPPRTRASRSHRRDWSPPPGSPT